MGKGKLPELFTEIFFLFERALDPVPMIHLNTNNIHSPMRTIWTLMATIWGMVVPTCSAIFSFQTLSPHLLFHVVGHAGSDFVECCSACCVIICHISQHHQNRRWCIFFKSIYFLTLIGLNNALVAKLTHMRHVSDQTRAVYLNLFLTEYSLWSSHSWTERKLRGKNDIIICPILQIWVINRVLRSESQSDGMNSKYNPNQTCIDSQD